VAKEVSMIVSWNGRLVDGKTVEMPVTDPLFLRGEGVFETIRFESGRACLWKRHFGRLRDSSKRMGWPLPDSGELLAEVGAVVDGNGFSTARVRITVGREVLVTAEAFVDEDPGIRVRMCSFPVNQKSPLAGVKGTSYAENTWILNHFGADEVIRPNTRGELCEGCISNVFFVRGKKVMTPSLETGCLPGVMRDEIMDRIEVEEGAWPMEVLEEADEIWFSNALRRLRYVKTIDHREMPGPSPLFQDLLSSLKDCETKA
jgi:branched-chain amino acid aminotransferase